MKTRHVRTAILCLLALRVFAFCYAWDRLPLLPTYDEAIINDPAVALSRGMGLVAFSYSGIPIADRYAHFPPLFMFLQAATFRIFGFSALTLRFWPIAFGVLSSLLLLCVLDRLWKRGVLAGWAAAVTACLCLVDLPTLWDSRAGRMDTMVVALGLAALALLLANPGHIASAIKWWVAALLIGSAMATHPAAIFYYWAFVVALWVFRSDLGWKIALGCSLLPGATLIAIWLGTHGEQSINAFRQFQTIHAQHQDLGMKFGYWWSLLLAGDAQMILYWGVTWVIVVGGWSAPVIAFLVSRKKTWAACALAGAGLYLIAWLLTGLFVPRVVVAFPLALLLFAVSLSALHGTGVKVAGVLIAVVLVVESVAMFGYLRRARGDDAGRSPGRFSALQFPAEASVASVPALWFEFMRRGRPLRVIYEGLPMDHNYWTAEPSRLEQYNIVILETDHPYLDFPGIRNRKITTVKDAGWEYRICEK
ncbi:MAG TPA: glycosyltransferase family 39 protein [Bryobacteraceae bacterium]|jgi:4-amino-4-deoxy-L-arabinose transferase-like glycosyltransferase|nr:glycosyltransferase family 39 protein [Bryobacteraceae bacterium]